MRYLSLKIAALKLAVLLLVTAVAGAQTNIDLAHRTKGISSRTHGPTQTSPPALIPGTNIQISGAWPNPQTVSANFYGLIFADGPQILFGAGPVVSVSRDRGSAGFLKVDTGLQTSSSVQIDNGSLALTQNSAYMALKNSGFFGFIQAGDPASGDPVWAAENTFTLPRLSASSSTPQSGFLLAITGGVAATAPGHGLFLDSEQGKMLDSGIGFNTHIVFPVNTRRIDWTHGRNTGSLTSAAVSANRIWTLPDTSGSVVVAASAPASASSPGVAGTVAFDSDFIYYCVAANTWKRVAIATW